MPSHPDNNFPECEERSGLHPTEHHTDARLTPPTTSRWITFLAKVAISARLLWKEIYRQKLKWFDLRRAELRLGRKAYTTRRFSDQGQLVAQLDQLQDEEVKLRQPNDRSASTFREKVKAFLAAAAKAARLAWLRTKSRGRFRKLGRAIRSDGSDHEEAQSANAAANRINSVNADIQELRSQTYACARRPLLLGCLIYFPQ